jgi:hypothetical protein
MDSPLSSAGPRLQNLRLLRAGQPAAARGCGAAPEQHTLPIALAKFASARDHRALAARCGARPK